MLELGMFRGTLSLSGSELLGHIERLSPGSEVEAPHITILSKDEIEKLAVSPIKEIDISKTSLQVLSVGEVKDVKFLTVSWPHAQLYRRELGLGAKDFHITLSKADKHDIRKDITTTKGGYPVFAKIFNELSEIEMDFILADLVTTNWHQELCREFLQKYHGSYRAMIRFADSSHDQPHLSMNAYARALSLNPTLHRHVTKNLKRLGPQAFCGPFQIECKQIPASLLHPWPAEARTAVRDAISKCTTEPRVHIHYLHETAKLPRFFSMPLPYRLAVMSTPCNARDIDVLSNIGVTTVLTLTKESPLDPTWFKFKKISNIYVPVTNYGCPSLAEMDYIYRLFKKDIDGFWLVHCGGGKGRAGTVTACLLAMHSSEDGTPKMEKSQAITLVRYLRPGSIETTQQEDFVASWLSHRWKIAHSSNTEIEEPYNTLMVESDLKEYPTGPNAKNVRFIMLVGLPGSGKSFIAESIALRRSSETIIISQDNSGSRAACETQIQGKYRDGTMVILDGCNPIPADRKYWLSLLPSLTNTICVHFDYDPALCLQRIDQRIGHPTIRAGKGGNAMKQMLETMQKPKLAEGFSAVLTVASHNAARQAILLLGGIINITKFPRTTHLINLGASTTDDIIKEDWEGDLNGQLVIEEKIDGANVGFSLDFERNLLVQNRSHYISYATHAQFKPLRTWLEKHQETITKLLDLDDKFPERYILYGEWVAAKHSIPYSQLPDFFMAFDFFDRKTKRFVSREYLTRMLDGTGLHQVPIIATVNRISRPELLAYMTRQSVFYSGPIEGVYVRFENGDRSETVDRGKIVRSDFIAGNEHWTKTELQMNQLQMEG